MSSNQPNRARALAAALLVVLAASLAAPGSHAEPPSAAEIDEVITTLEDPEARAQLIRRLQVLRAASEAPEEPAARIEPPVQTAAVELLRTLSARMVALGGAVLRVAGAVNELPAGVAWLRNEASDPERRSLWASVLVNLSLVLGLGYMVLYGVRLAMGRMVSRAAAAVGDGVTRRVARLVLLAGLELVPVAAFALTAYAALTLVDPREATRLVALAWINASVIVRVTQALAKLVLAPAHSGLRIPPLSDETAHYADIWVRRISLTTVYGYFGLQAGLLLGLPAPTYHGLLRLLGLVVAGLLVILTFQNREPVSGWLAGDGEGGGRWAGFRRRVAGTWHLLAVLYIFLLYGIWALDLPGGFLYLLRGTALTLVVVAVAFTALRIVGGVFSHGLRIGAELRQRFPGLEARTNRYLPVMHVVLRWLVYGLTALAVLQAWGVDAFGWVGSAPSRALGATLLKVALLAAAAAAIWELTSALIESYLAEVDGQGRARVRSARSKTLLGVARNAVFAVVTVVTTLLILSELGINIAPLLAGAGVVGLAVGFGAQTLVKDIITGVIILFQDLIAVGEVVKVGETAGLVEAVSIRHVRLRDLSGTVHTIPFSAITTISNLTKDFSFYVFDIGIAYREDADEVMAVLRAVGEELQADPEFGPQIREPLEILGVDRFADSAVVIKARIKTDPIKQWGVGREFNRRMKRRFDELGIEIPFPHRTLFFGEGKDGTAPPGRVVLEQGAGAAATPVDAPERGPAPAEKG